MRLRLIAIAILLFPSLAFAQQPPHQVTPWDAAIQVDSIINQIAQVATNEQHMIESLQKQIRDQQQEIADLHKKLDAAKVPPVASAVPLPPVPPHQ